MREPIILRGARVVDPANGIDELRDVGIAEGLIVPPPTIPHATVCDVGGKVITPGFIDLHVHLRDPGHTHKEDIATGTRAAASGGFTTVVAMPNTLPAVDCPAVLLDVAGRVKEHAVVRVLQTAALTRGRKGLELTDADALKAAGAAALTDDGACIQDAALMLRALQHARDVGIGVIDHCEDTRISGNGVMHAGECSRRLGLAGVPAAAEELMVARDVVLARETGSALHVQHISSAGSVALVRFAQAQGIAVTAEACVHHICLTDDACLEYGTNAKMNPPLRTEDDRQAVLEGLKDNTIAVIATDHAPHSAEEKGVAFADAPFGVVGLEAAVAVCLTELYHKGVLTLPQLVAKFTTGPRQVLGLPGGSLEPGAAADITVLDPEADVVMDVSSFRSRSRNCPYDAWRCRGKAVATIVAGEFVHGGSGACD